MIPETLKHPPLVEALGDCMNIPEDVRLIRTALSLSQSEFARKFGVSRGAVCQWEHGQRTPIDGHIMVAIIRWADSLEPYQQSSRQ